MKSFQIGHLLVLAVLVTGDVEAATWYVANNAVDSATCGTQVSPCRTIGQAIANAAPGDTIVVGPGIYGNISLGHYAGSPSTEPVPIVLNKALIVESSHGADLTRLNGVMGGTYLVEIVADGVTFGRPGKGFTLYQPESGNGLIMADGTTSGSVNGNVFLDVGVEIAGNGHTLNQNRFFGTVFGFSTAVAVSGVGHSITDNVVSGAAGDEGFFISGTGHFVTNNAALGSVTGITFSQTSSTVVRGNSVLANFAQGMRFNSSATISGNNIFGNGVGVEPAPASNCGILNDSGGTIDATNNFWGAASGPGPDPADAICDATGSTTLATPFSAQQFAIPSHGSGAPGIPATKEDCNGTGWQDLSRSDGTRFKNQGACVVYVNKGR